MGVWTQQLAQVMGRVLFTGFSMWCCSTTDPHLALPITWPKGWIHADDTHVGSKTVLHPLFLLIRCSNFF
jgi:hypothetical protein